MKKKIKLLQFSKQDIADLTQEEQRRLIGGQDNTLPTVCVNCEPTYVDCPITYVCTVAPDECQSDAYCPTGPTGCSDWKSVCPGACDTSIYLQTCACGYQ